MFNFYNNNAANYETLTQDIDPSLFLDPLVLKLNPSSSILDVGCGVGRDLKWLKDKGFSVCGLDQSPNLVDIARRNTRCRVIREDFTFFDFSQYSFDAIILIGSLVHIPHLDLLPTLKSILQALKKTGTVLITMKEGKGIKKRRDGRCFYLWSFQDLETIFQNCGFKTSCFFRQKSQMRNDDVWLVYLLKRN